MGQKENKDLSVYEEWLVHRELEKLQESALHESFRNGDYYKPVENKNTKLWNKLRDEE